MQSENHVSNIVSYQGSALETLGSSREDKVDSTVPVLANGREIYTTTMPHQTRVTSRSSSFKRFMQILVRQNFIGDAALSRSHTTVQWL
jgi:hypothetical protein